MHSNNSVTALVDGEGCEAYCERLPNDLGVIVRELGRFREAVVGIVVESTFNWYWLVDGLMEAGYRMHLANTTAIQQYSGLKHGDDQSDALWLAEMLRLGVLREGYIYPKAERGLRDLLRQRGRLVQQRTGQILSIQNQVHRSTGKRLSGNAIKALEQEQVGGLVSDPNLVLSIVANLGVLGCLSEHIRSLERAVLKQAKPRPEFRWLQTVPGIGEVLGLVVLLETGDVRRFAAAGNFSSYCRCVASQRLSNGKRKGKGNVKNGNRYLAWAFVEAAHFAIRYYPVIQRFYQRKEARTNAVVALKTVAHKLARASYYVLRDQVPFEMTKSFG